ncbi:hypothetical protein HDU93_003061 [Gonapodya sp. JEL0774]|nr:hypothetical protein HDU93_003061 [Gonapodya sp. JEL0774]
MRRPRSSRLPTFASLVYWATDRKNAKSALILARLFSGRHAEVLGNKPIPDDYPREEDASRAFGFYELAACNGSAEGMREVARILGTGIAGVVEKDEAKAKSLLVQAAEEYNDVEATRMLAQYYPATVEGSLPDEASSQLSIDQLDELLSSHAAAFLPPHLLRIKYLLKAAHAGDLHSLQEAAQTLITGFPKCLTAGMGLLWQGFLEMKDWRCGKVLAGLYTEGCFGVRTDQLVVYAICQKMMEETGYDDSEVAAMSVEIEARGLIRRTAGSSSLSFESDPRDQADLNVILRLEASLCSDSTAVDLLVPKPNMDEGDPCFAVLPASADSSLSAIVLSALSSQSSPTLLAQFASRFLSGEPRTRVVAGGLEFVYGPLAERPDICIELLEKAGELGFGDAYAAAGEVVIGWDMYYMDWESGSKTKWTAGEKRDKAIEYLRLGAELGSIPCMKMLAELVGAGDGERRGRRKINGEEEDAKLNAWLDKLREIEEKEGEVNLQEARAGAERSVRFVSENTITVPQCTTSSRDDYDRDEMHVDSHYGSADNVDLAIASSTGKEDTVVDPAELTITPQRQEIDIGFVEKAKAVESSTSFSQRPGTATVTPTSGVHVPVHHADSATLPNMKARKLVHSQPVADPITRLAVPIAVGRSWSIAEIGTIGGAPGLSRGFGFPAPNIAGPATAGRSKSTVFSRVFDFGAE